MKRRFLPFLVLFIFSLAHAEIKVPSVKRAKKIEANAKINFDFTKMNYNMACGIIFDMMIDPENYKNKTVKIKGQFATEVHEGNRMFAVIIWDSGGCCPTGLGIVPLEGKKYPDDFPKEGSEITVTGTLEILNIYGGDALCLVAEIWN